MVIYLLLKLVLFRILYQYNLSKLLVEMEERNGSFIQMSRPIEAEGKIFIYLYHIC